MQYDSLHFIDEIALKSRDDGLIPDPDKGIGRECHAFSHLEADVQDHAEKVARIILSGHVEGEDFKIRRSAAGSLIVTFYGRRRGLKAVVAHSHLDSVPNGGKYDGVAGVAWALSVLDEVARMPVKPLRSLKVIAWVSEESSPKNGVGCLGSAIATATISHETIDGIEYDAGRPLREFLAKRWQTIHGELYEPIISTRNTECAYELHIEQGTCIAKSGKQIGIVVSGIGGAKRYKLDAPLSKRSIFAAEYERVRIVFVGVSDHTGATPPNPEFFAAAPNRKDALVCSCFLLTRLLSEGRARLERLEPERDTSFTSIPSKMIADVAIHRGDRAWIDRFLAESIREMKRAFGVDVEWKIGGDVSGLVDPNNHTILSLPVLVSTLSSRAMAREGGLGTTRATVTDFHLTPDRVSFKLDLREVNPPDLATLERNIVRAIDQLFGEPLLKTVSEKRSQPVDESLVNELRRSADQLGISYTELPSHAGQDSDRLAAAGIPVAMCFVRQEDGISHSPYERMEPRDFEAASRVMTRAVLTSLATL